MPALILRFYPLAFLMAASVPTIAEAAVVGGVNLPHGLSPWGMFVAADWVVKAVMVGLMLASVATWTVFVAKFTELRRISAAHSVALKQIRDADGLTDAGLTAPASATTVHALLAAARREIIRSADALDDADGLKERIASVLDRTEAAAVRSIRRGISILATIGSTAPFVGLFGTVWGIMNSFVGIAASQTTNLAVVAPGIAEALLATAMGLIAAIPAVMIYNVFTRHIAGYRALVADLSAAVSLLVSRDISRGRIMPPSLQVAG